MPDTPATRPDDDWLRLDSSSQHLRRPGSGVDWLQPLTQMTAPPVPPAAALAGSATLEPRPPLVVAGLGRVKVDDLAALLRFRLKWMTMAIAGVYTASWLFRVAFADLVDSRFWVRLFPSMLFIASLWILVALLYTPLARTMKALRGLELGLVGLVAAFFAFSEFRLLHLDGFLQGFRARPRQEISVFTQHFVLPWFALIMIYGAVIPNTWRRCLGVVTILVILPIATFFAAELLDGAPSREMGHLFLMLSVPWLLIAAGFAVFGSYRISFLRQVAADAQQFGQYRLRRRLGQGGMGEVYLAEHQMLRRPCALKLIRPDLARQPQTVARFTREVEAMTHLTHFNNVQVYDFGQTAEGSFYYVMEYCDGLTLAELVAAVGPLPVGRVVYLLRQLCVALWEAHGLGLVHRDLKPGNVMLVNRGGFYDLVKLLDFGLVAGEVYLRQPRKERLSGSGLEEQTPTPATQGEALTHPGSILGTPDYMSPEQVRGEGELDGRSDLYSLGAVAYFLLTGRPMFGRLPLGELLDAVLMRDPRPLTEAEGAPPDVAAIVARCLLKRPEDRFATVADLEAALGECSVAHDWSGAQAAEWWEHHAHLLKSAGHNKQKAGAPAQAAPTVS